MTPPLLSTQDLDHLHRMLPQEVGHKYDPVTQGNQRDLYRPSHTAVTQGIYLFVCLFRLGIASCQEVCLFHI